MAKTHQQLADLVRKISQQLSQLADELSGEIEPEATFTCKSCNLEKPLPLHRGVCKSCYERVMKMIRMGKITETEAIEAGLITAEKEKGGRKLAVKTALDQYLENKEERPKIVDEMVRKSPRKEAKK